MSYQDKLRNPKWQERRLRIFDRDGWSCTLCGAAETELHVHHAYYVSQRDPWRYPDFALSTICATCHSKTCRHGTDAIESIIDAVASFARDHRDFEDVLSCLAAALVRGKPEQVVNPMASMGAASYALQRALEALRQGHDPELIRCAIEVAFDQVLGPVPHVRVDQAWLADYSKESV